LTPDMLLVPGLKVTQNNVRPWMFLVCTYSGLLMTPTGSPLIVASVHIRQDTRSAD
jgi:hypothetical protein